MISSNYQQHLECIICLELCQQAVECQECNQLMCEQCANSLTQKACPFCRKNLNVKPNQLARRILSDTPTKCSYCGIETTIGNISDHIQKCPNANVQQQQLYQVKDNSESITNINQGQGEPSYPSPFLFFPGNHRGHHRRGHHGHGHHGPHDDRNHHGHHDHGHSHHGHGHGHHRGHHRGGHHRRGNCYHPPK